MAITADANAIEAKYGGGKPAASVPTQDLYYPGGGTVPSQQGQVPQGTPIPEGEFVQQVVGRGMMVVPPQEKRANQPQISVMPPTGSGRTSIGTFVEVKQEALASEPATPPPEPQPRRELDLAKEILTHIWELGGDKSEAAQKFYERSHDTLKNWTRNPSMIPLGAINKFLQRQPGIRELLLEQLEPHFAANGKENWTQSLPNRTKTSVVVCAPILGQPTLPFLWVCLYLAKKYELGFDIQADTMIHRSRNMLAHRFLQSGATWSLWLDGDIAAPIANPDWYRWITNSTTIPQEYTAYDVLARLQGHGKAVMGAVYASRKYHGSLVMQPEINPRSHEDKLLCNAIRSGNARGIAEVDWIGFGCALVHREVFLEVQRNFQNLKPVTEFSPWRFFQPEADEGEDEAFSRRIRSCSIPIWLDTQLICPHIGNMAFLPEHTQPVMAL